MTITTTDTQTAADPAAADPHEGDSQLTPTNRAWTIVARGEIVGRLTDKAFIIGTLVTIALMVGLAGVGAYLSNRTTDVVLVTSAADRATAASVAKAAEARDGSFVISVSVAATDAEAEELVKDGSADGWLQRDTNGWILTGDSALDPALVAILKDAIRSDVIAANAQAQGTSVQALAKGSDVTTKFLSPAKDEDAEVRAQVVGFVLALLFYVSSLVFGMMLANSIVGEKSSRVVEIIASKVPVTQLLIGKIVGNSVLAFVQMAVFAAVGLVAMSVLGLSSSLLSVVGSVGWFLAFFIAGFVMLAALWTMVASVCSSTEDLNSASMPLTVLMMFTYVSIFIFTGPGLVIASFVPPLSCVLMPYRLAQGTAQWWEPIVALLLISALAAVLVRIASRIYIRGLLQTQGKISIRQAWRTEV